MKWITIMISVLVIVSSATFGVYSYYENQIVTMLAPTPAPIDCGFSGHSFADECTRPQAPPAPEPPVHTVPEPSTLWLVLPGLLWLARRRTQPKGTP